METVLMASERKEKAKISRKKGLIPGIVYGKNTENLLVSFQKTNLMNTLKSKGEKAKINLDLNGKKMRGIIKQVEREISTGNIIHIDIQSINKDEEVKWSIPISFSGKEALQNKDLYVQVYSNEIEVDGIVAQIPDNIEIDVSKMEFGQEIKVKDLKIDDSIKISKEEDAILAVITNA
ncbi:50S ribosomal protein L25 [Clostridium rectalis]|uniref:50S ribosomal protein L25 n=1 Tax=Clostridium rectalis TaxID=2040295 RepID=UPI000F6346BF|nr:50S ribosomal protein L25 [Clostridium rectalis]